MPALDIAKGSSRHSAYNLRPDREDAPERHTLAVIVDNEAGVLARVIGLFSGRGYNIESLTVAEVDHEGHRSRITVVTTGTPQIIEQIIAQLGRIVPVHEVHDLTVEGRSVERELSLLKVVGIRATGASRRSGSPTSSAPTWSTRRSTASCSRSRAPPRRWTPLPISCAPWASSRSRAPGSRRSFGGADTGRAGSVRHRPAGTHIGASAYEPYLFSRFWNAGELSSFESSVPLLSMSKSWK